LSLVDRLKAALLRLVGREASEPERAAPPETSLQPGDLAVLRSVRRCTACRACDVAFDGYAEAARPIFRGPSELVSTYARRVEDHGAAKRYLESLRRGDLEELERICPVRIPFVALADLVERRAHALEPDEAAPDEAPRPRHDPG
jgi:hypothetical protein